MKKTILVRLSALIEIDEVELDKDFNHLDKIDFELSDQINKILKFEEDSTLGYQATRTEILDQESMNCGQCSNCGTWVSDREQPNHIPDLNIGATYKGELLCDEHLPRNHRWAF